ncbi:MAG TPA: ATP-binding protein, partial [Puia sp.]|nr:ATP-binding protein [Puia sp.]
VAQEYIELFTRGEASAPHFGMSFPAKKVTTPLERKHLVVSPQLDRQIDYLLEWRTYHPGLKERGAVEGRFRQGFRTLFHGPSGTGKTFTAKLLGKEMKKDVYRVDLSMVVSKYIGETEKNLELLFARAEDKDWILFFDEADAIFSKRTGVKEAHDKYANQEVSYLLQRIEDYNGLVILASNMRNNIDEAFIRRFNSILHFPMPDVDQRKKIWEKTFLDGTKFRQTEKKEGKEVEREADMQDIIERIKQYQLSGGGIQNVVHYASIKGIKRSEERAGKSGKKDLIIRLDDMIEGIRLEFGKYNIPFS